MIDLFSTPEGNYSIITQSVIEKIVDTGKRSNRASFAARAGYSARVSTRV